VGTDTSTLVPTPAYVPPELVRDFNFKIKARVAPTVDPISYIYDVMDRDNYPEVFWTPRNRGHWVVRRFEDVREVMRSDAMTTFPAGIPADKNRPWRMKPIELDPPEHEKYRSILAPLFTPKAVRALEGKVREVAIEVIEEFANKGECEFVRDFAFRMPTRILMSMIGYDSDDAALDEFLPWVHQFFRGNEAEVMAGGTAILAYVEQFVDKRIAEPTEDLISMMLHKVTFPTEQNRRMTRQEVIDMGFQLFVASLDTVPSTFVTAWRFLALNTEAQESLLSHPDRMDEAVEEMLRLTGVVSSARRTTRDFVIKGVTIPAGESILLPLSVANRDPAVFDKPTEMVLDREDNQHLTFGAGQHRCLGSHFARTEVRIVLEEWSRRIPRFTIKPETLLDLDASSTVTVLNLPLVWETQK
jgi:cytochrome P450